MILNNNKSTPDVFIHVCVFVCASMCMLRLISVWCVCNAHLTWRSIKFMLHTRWFAINKIFVSFYSNFFLFFLSFTSHRSRNLLLTFFFFNKFSNKMCVPMDSSWRWSVRTACSLRSLYDFRTWIPLSLAYTPLSLFHIYNFYNIFFVYSS